MSAYHIPPAFLIVRSRTTLMPLRSAVLEVRLCAIYFRIPDSNILTKDSQIPSPIPSPNRRHSSVSLHPQHPHPPSTPPIPPSQQPPNNHYKPHTHSSPESHQNCSRTLHSPTPANPPLSRCSSLAPNLALTLWRGNLQPCAHAAPHVHALEAEGVERFDSLGRVV